MNYKEANALLTGRNKDRKKLENNTWLERRGEDIAVRLHNTDILLFKSNGDTVANTDGWKTSTTKDRLNKYLPHGYSIGQDGGVWYWHRYAQWNQPSPPQFADGDVIKANSDLKAQATPSKTKEDLKLRNKVVKYAKLCADSVPLEKPGGGDCWYCLMKTEDGKSLGDSIKRDDHILSHMDEKYVVPSLVFRALKEAGNTDFIIGAMFDKDHPEFAKSFKDRVSKAVKKYIFKRLGMAH